MKSEMVKESLRKFSEVLSFNYPAVGWYFSSEEMEDSFIFRKDKWVCMFMYLKMMMKKNKKIPMIPKFSWILPFPMALRQFEARARVRIRSL